MADQLDQFLGADEPAQEVIDPIIIDAMDETTGVEEPVPPTDPAPVVDDTTAKMKAFETAMIQERRKRQELEYQLAQRQQVQDEDRDEYAESIINKVRVEQDNARIVDKIKISQELVREKYSDYDEKEAIFIQMTEQNPLLIEEMRSSANPANFAYRTATNQQKLAEMGDPLEYEKKLTEKITAKVTADLKKQFDNEAAKRDNLPGSLAGTRGAAGTHTAEWSGPPPLSDILG
jgi:hypothetical protein